MTIRRILMCLLMLAIPVQGMAASTMLLCGPNHHRQQHAAPAVHEHSAQEHVVQAHAAHAHEAHEAHAVPAGHEAHLAHQAHDLPDLSKSKCSACASCCSALAILGTFPSVAVAERHESRTPALTTDFEPVFIDGPEKPPRAFLA